MSNILSFLIHFETSFENNTKKMGGILSNFAIVWIHSLRKMIVLDQISVSTEIESIQIFWI